MTSSEDRRELRSAVEKVWRAIYRSKPMKEEELRQKLRDLSLVDSVGLGDDRKEKVAAITGWIEGRVTREAGHPDSVGRIDVHRGIVRLFGERPSFADPEFDVVAQIGARLVVWRFGLNSARLDPRSIPDSTLTRLLGRTGRSVVLTQVLYSTGQTGTIVEEAEIAVPPGHMSSQPLPDVANESRPAVLPIGTLQTSGTKIQADPGSPPNSSPPRRLPGSAAPGTPDKVATPTASERQDGVIGTIGPAPPTMGRAGGYVVNGILYVPEIPDIAVTKGLPVIAESRKDPANPKSPLIRVYARIGQTSVETASTIERAPTSTTYVDSTFEIVREAYPSEHGGVDVRPWTPKAMGGYRIRWPRGEDLALMGYPDTGVCIGWQEGVPSKLRYWFPVDAIYRSLFVVGGMGGGKTNFISCIARSIANRDPAAFPDGLRPAVVILDAEGRREYADLATEVPLRLRPQLEELGIAPHGVRDFKYHSIGKGGRCFQFSDIPPQDTAVFPASLPTKSERAWIHGAELFWKHAQAAGRRVTAAQATAAIAGINLPLGINSAMRAAIMRAADDSCWDVFDIPETEALTVDELLHPGRVSVVDVSNLAGGDRIRAAGLALLTLFDVAKRRQPQHPCPIILVVDEATRLVPAGYSGMSAKDYTDKMGKWLTEILHRGRRASYGLVLATQYPDDVLRGLADQPQTKVAFALAPRYDRWVDSNFADAAGARLRELASPGVGFVARTARVDGDPQGVPHPATVIHFPQVR